MRPIDTPRAGLPVAIEARSTPFFSSQRGTPKAAFLSQLIAERHHLAPQRERRQAPVSDALRVYDQGGRLSVRRLPAGYRLKLDA